MTVSLKPYTTHRDSAIAELGTIPAHWQVRPLSALGSFFKGKGASKEDEVASGVPCVRYGDLYTRHEFFICRTRAFITRERRRLYTPIQFGDVLFAGSGETIEDIGRSAVVLIDGEACCGGDVIGLRPNREFVPRFLGYACDSAYAKVQKSRMARGFTVVHIYPSELKRLFLAVPTINEQHDIARYLDYVNRRIRRYVCTRQKLIRLLNEQKHAIIHRAVTRGLDPNVRFKSSGLEWLGDVPEHWEIRRNGRLFAQRNEVGFGELPILEVSLKTGVRVRELTNPIRKQVMADKDKYKRAAVGDIAYNMMRMWQGACGVAPVDGLVSPAYVVARPLEGTESRYFAYLYRTAAYMRETDKYSRGIVKDRNRLYWEDFKQMPSPSPPAEEQRRIADAIDERMQTITKSIGKIDRELALFGEYRRRLVADVVTGKLDVRKTAAALPPEADEEERLEIEGQGDIGDENEAADVEAAEEVGS